jgi:hypothetical protein
MLKRIALLAVVALEVFLGTTAIFGAIWVVPSQPRALLAGSLFADYTVPALALGVVVGGGSLAATGLLLVRRQPGILLSVAVGAAIIVFELVETAVMGLNVWLHAVGLGPVVAMERFGNLDGIPSPLGVPLPLWLQPLYIVVGLLIVGLTLMVGPSPISVVHPARIRPLPVMRRLTIAYVVTSLVAVCLVVSSAAGLLFGQRGLYEPNPATLPAFLTQDVLSLLVAVPLLIGSMWTARRGSVRGLLLWMGALFYVAYAYSYAVLGDRLSPLFLVYVAIISMSLYSLLYLALSTDAEAVKSHFSGNAPTTLAGAFVALMALALASMWVAIVLGDLLSHTAPTRVQLVVWPLDLVVAFPALFWGGIYLWRRNALGYVAGGIVLLKSAAEGLTLVVQTWVTVLMGGPGDPLVPAYVIVGLGGLVLLIAFLQGAGPSRPVESEPEASRRNGGVRVAAGITR